MLGRKQNILRIEKTVDLHKNSKETSITFNRD